MTYTAPSSVTTGDLIKASRWNTDLVDNIIHLHDRPKGHLIYVPSSLINATTGTFIDADNTNLKITQTIESENVLLIATLTGRGAFSFRMDGTTYADNHLNGSGLGVHGVQNNGVDTSVVVLGYFSGITAGISHYFTLQLAQNTVSSGDGRIIADYPVSMFLIEV